MPFNIPFSESGESAHQTYIFNNKKEFEKLVKSKTIEIEKTEKKINETLEKLIVEQKLKSSAITLSKVHTDPAAISAAKGQIELASQKVADYKLGVELQLFDLKDLFDNVLNMHLSYFINEFQSLGITRHDLQDFDPIAQKELYDLKMKLDDLNEEIVKAAAEKRTSLSSDNSKKKNFNIKTMSDLLMDYRKYAPIYQKKILEYWNSKQSSKLLKKSHSFGATTADSTLTGPEDLVITERQLARPADRVHSHGSVTSDFSIESLDVQPKPNGEKKRSSLKDFLPKTLSRSKSKKSTHSDNNSLGRSNSLIGIFRNNTVLRSGSATYVVPSPTVAPMDSKSLIAEPEEMHSSDMSPGESHENQVLKEKCQLLSSNLLQNGVEKMHLDLVNHLADSRAQNKLLASQLEKRSMRTNSVTSNTDQETWKKYWSAKLQSRIMFVDISLQNPKLHESKRVALAEEKFQLENFQSSLEFPTDELINLELHDECKSEILKLKEEKESSNKIIGELKVEVARLKGLSENSREPSDNSELAESYEDLKARYTILMESKSNIEISAKEVSRVQQEQIQEMSIEINDLAKAYTELKKSSDQEYSKLLEKFQKNEQELELSNSRAAGLKEKLANVTTAYDLNLQESHAQKEKHQDKTMEDLKAQQNMQEKFAHLEKTIEHLKIDLMQAEDETQILVRDNESQVDQLNAKISQLSFELEETNSKLNSNQGTNFALNKKVKEFEEKDSINRNLINSLEKDIKQALEEKAQMDAALRKDLEIVETKLQAANAKIVEVELIREKMNSESKSAITALEAKILEEKSHVLDLEKKNIENETNLNSQKKKELVVQGEKRALEEAVQRLGALQTSLENQLAASESNVLERQRALDEKVSLLKNAQDTINSLQASLEERTKSEFSMNEKQNSLSQHIDQLEVENKNLMSSLAGQSQEIGYWKSQQHYYEQQFYSAHESNVSLQKEVNRLMEKPNLLRDDPRLQELLEKNIELIQSVAKKDSEISELQKKHQKEVENVNILKKVLDDVSISWNWSLWGNTAPANPDVNSADGPSI